VAAAVASALVRQAGALTVAIASLAAAALALGGRPEAALVLTLSAAIAMINALWLERALDRVLQPGKPQFPRGAVLLLLGRWGLWFGFLVVLFVLRRHLPLWAVAVGLTCFMIALASAGLGRPARDAGEE
jgi:hypothetical protein